jgi:hypothetical protein
VKTNESKKEKKRNKEKGEGEKDIKTERGSNATERKK